MFFEKAHVEVAASQTDSVLGAGDKGDILTRLICSVTAVGAGGAVSIKDVGGAAIPILPASTAIGVHVVEMGAISTGTGWSVTTGASVTVMAVGAFK